MIIILKWFEELVFFIYEWIKFFIFSYVISNLVFRVFEYFYVVYSIYDNKKYDFIRNFFSIFF